MAIEAGRVTVDVLAGRGIEGKEGGVRVQFIEGGPVSKRADLGTSFPGIEVPVAPGSGVVGGCGGEDFRGGNDPD
jgi:hypothetical protein